MIISRRRLLAAGSSAFVAGIIGAPFVARAQQAEFAYKYANNLPATHPMNTRAQEMAAAIKAETNGRFDMQIFPSSQLGSDTDTLSQVRSGGVEFFTLSGLILSTLVPAASINGVGFAFPDYATVWKAMDGDLGAYVRQQIAKANLIAMDKIWDNGFRQTTSSTKPITGARRPQGLQDPRAGFAALDVHVQGVRFRAHLDQLQRGLHGASDQGRRRTGEPARDRVDREAVRGAEVPLDDQSHVGRLLVPRQSPRLGATASGCPHHRGEAHQRGRGEGARGRRQA